jgi:hypothetical protein
MKTNFTLTGSAFSRIAFSSPAARAGCAAPRPGNPFLRWHRVLLTIALGLFFLIGAVPGKAADMAFNGVIRLPDGRIQIFWPMTPPGFILLTASNLNSPEWNYATNETFISGTNYSATVTPNGGSAFFRLFNASTALATGPAGVSLYTPTNILSAFNLFNFAAVPVDSVVIDSLTVSNRALTSPILPLNLGTIDRDGSAVVEADFGGGTFVPGNSYILAVTGSYFIGTSNYPFSTNVSLLVPPSVPPPSNSVVSVGSYHVTNAPYAPQAPEFDDDVNSGGPPIPTAPFVDAPVTTNESFISLPPGSGPGPRPNAGTIVWSANDSIGTGGNEVRNDRPAEPSGASSSNVIFLTFNWSAAYSTNGGATFTRLDPTRVFPASGVGFCCDQIVQYIPSIDRFIWMLQGSGQRIAMASPAQIISSHGTAWTVWDFTPGLIGEGSFDYPDLAVGNNYLYMSWNASGGTSGHFVGRTSLTGLQAGGTISIQYYIRPEGGLWFAHMTQNCGDGGFFAAHNDNRHMRIFSWPETSGLSWRDITLPRSWANNAATLSSTTPDGMDWLTKARGVGFVEPIGCTRAGNLLWFAWNAGTDSFFQKAHVEMVTLDHANNDNVVQQVQIWNNSYAFAYPALSTSCDGEVAMSLEYGGPSDYENHVVGFWGDFIVYITTGSNVGSTRYGDYTTIRQMPPTSDNPGNLFSAFGYGVNSIAPPGTTAVDIHYVLFGRPPSSCLIP